MTSVKQLTETAHDTFVVQQQNACGIMTANDLFLQLCMFSLQLGFLSTFLSEPIVKAFTSAAAFHVTISQLQSMLGLRLPRHTGTFSLFKVHNNVDIAV